MKTNRKALRQVYAQVLTPAEMRLIALCVQMELVEMDIAQAVSEGRKSDADALIGALPLRKQVVLSYRLDLWRRTKLRHDALKGASR